MPFHGCLPPTLHSYHMQEEPFPYTGKTLPTALGGLAPSVVVVVEGQCELGVAIFPSGSGGGANPSQWYDTRSSALNKEGCLLAEPEDMPY